ncbi:hypothetical protein GCK32_016725, partial [Trichostrongylus colubriformis]
KHDMASHGVPHDDLLEKSYGDLIDIPRNEPAHPEPPKYDHEHEHEHEHGHQHGDHASSTDSKSNTLNSFDLLGEQVHETDEQKPEHKEEHPHKAEHDHKDDRYRQHYGEDSDSDEPDFRSHESG